MTPTQHPTRREHDLIGEREIPDKHYTGRGVYELVLEKKLLSREELEHLLTPETMLKPQHISSRREADRGA